MATTTINFSQQGAYYYSDGISASGEQMVINVQMQTPGGVVLERSITGTNWVYAQTITPDGYGQPVLEFSVTGITPGQQLRLRFEKSVPTTITVLQ